MIRVLVWNEYVHERTDTHVGEVYPGGIHACIRDFLSSEDVSVACVTMDMPNNGLTEALLDETDVLIWWGHLAHDQVSDEVADMVCRHVQGGMGLIVLHSGHLSKVFRRLTGATCNLKWRHDDRERLWCIAPWHPIAEGVPEQFEIPHEEMYGEPFDIPNPEQVIFMGWFAGGEVFRSGVTYTRGLGKIFYFQPGHEEYPVYKNETVQRIIRNAVRWVCPIQKKHTLIPVHNTPKLEN